MNKIIAALFLVSASLLALPAGLPISPVQVTHAATAHSVPLAQHCNRHGHGGHGGDNQDCHPGPGGGGHCRTHGYSHADCTVVPRSGTFTIHVPQTGIFLRGTGTPGTAGTNIVTYRISPPCPMTPTPQGFKLVANGPIPPLTPTHGTLYRYNTGTGTCSKVSSVTGPGLYEVVSP